MFRIAVDYADADDCDSLRTDPVFKMAVGGMRPVEHPARPRDGSSLLTTPPRRPEHRPAARAHVPCDEPG
jgi:hypothetical protein